jgi:hypothetical protein
MPPTTSPTDKVRNYLAVAPSDTGSNRRLARSVAIVQMPERVGNRASSGSAPALGGVPSARSVWGMMPRVAVVRPCRHRTPFDPYVATGGDPWHEFHPTIVDTSTSSNREHTDRVWWMKSCALANQDPAAGRYLAAMRATVFMVRMVACPSNV